MHGLKGKMGDQGVVGPSGAKGSLGTVGPSGDQGNKYFVVADPHKIFIVILNNKNIIPWVELMKRNKCSLHLGFRQMKTLLHFYTYSQN